METKDEKFFDAVIHITIVNLFTLSKKHGGIILTNYNNSIAHKCILKIAKISKDMLGVDVRIRLPLYKYIFWILFSKNGWCKRDTKSTYDSVDINELITHMETANEYLNLYEKIYEIYYKRG